MILTISTNITDQRYDMDIPGDVPISKVVSDLAECLSVLTNHDITSDKLAIICNRKDTILNPYNTLRDEGVWQGDLITVMYMQ